MASRRTRRSKRFSSYLAALNSDISRIESRPITTGIAAGVIDGTSLSSNIVLENNFLQSSNYIPNLYGWKIDSDGNAEFGNVYVRGNINAETGTIGYWNISSPTVERVIGDRVLFGTFIESGDLGATDEGKDSGTYVALFKSYEEDGVAVTNKWRVNNIATIRAPQHGFQNGDYVNINLDDSDPTYSTGASNVRIFDVSGDLFSYVNYGADEVIYNANLAVDVDTTAYGTATLYVKDVAGLYLQDYGRSQFDYGFFSNEGMAYVSAETPNLVYNPSFEFRVDTTYQYSDDSWVQGSVNIASYEYSSTDDYNGDSTYGAAVFWNDNEYSTYLHAQVNQSEIARLDYYKNDRELYLNFDIFPHQIVDPVIIPAENSFYWTSNTTITINCAGHGLAVDDLVYFDFVSNQFYYYNHINKVHTVTSVSGDEFTVTNLSGTIPTNPNTGLPFAPNEAASIASGSGVSPVFFKYIQMMLDLNDIRVSFVTSYDIDGNPNLDSSTLLYDLLTDVTIADWNNYRYWYMEVADFLKWYRGSAPSLYRPLQTMAPTHSTEIASVKAVSIKLSSSKLEAKYRELSTGNILVGGEFYISFPEWLWEGTHSNSGSTPVIRNVKALSAGSSFEMGYILDNVSLSTNKKFFYGDSGSSSFYYRDLDGVISNVNPPRFVSYEAPRKWIDIDLDFQTAQLNYMDSIEFKSADFYKQLFINPGITTVKDQATRIPNTLESLLSGESSVLNITSGQYRYVDAPNSYRSVEAKTVLETGLSSAVYQVKAVSSAEVNRSIQPPTNEAGGILSVGVSSDDLGVVSAYGDYLFFAGYKNIKLVASDDANGEDRTDILLEPSNFMVTALSFGGAAFTANTDYFGIGASYNPYLGYSVNLDAIISDTIAATLLSSSYSSLAISTVDNSIGYISSSIETKKNIEPLALDVSRILSVEPVQFNYKTEEDDSPKHGGFIAEQLVSVGLEDYVAFDAEGKPVTVNYDRYVSALQLVVKHLAAQVEELSDRVWNLEN